MALCAQNLQLPTTTQKKYQLIYAFCAHDTLLLLAHICCFFCEPALGFLGRMRHAKLTFRRRILSTSILWFTHA